MQRRLLRELDAIFTDREAWFLFRWSAFLETFGWTLLLIGILFQVNKWPGDLWLLPVGGSLHGLFVIAYMFIAFFVHRSFTQKWSIRKMLLAEAISVIPYGALAFELYEAKRRRT
jgi:integral membrane protein